MKMDDHPEGYVFDGWHSTEDYRRVAVRFKKVVPFTYKPRNCEPRPGRLPISVDVVLTSKGYVWDIRILRYRQLTMDMNPGLTDYAYRSEMLLELEEREHAHVREWADYQFND